MKLSAPARIALRKAITNHSSWDQYRKDKNLSLATMGRDDYFMAARDLGLDINAIAVRANNGSERPVITSRPIATPAHDKTEAAKRAFSDDSGISVNSEEFADDEDFDSDMPKPAPIKLSGFPKSEDKSASADKLMRLIAELAGSSVNEDDVSRIVEKQIKAILEKSGHSVQIELTTDGVSTKKLKGTHHPQFAKLLQASTARANDGFVPNCWIAGPAGSGKTYAVSKIAEALEAPFHFNGAIGMSHELLGFIDGAGFYHRTAFREAYEHGGCYLFDEVDGSDNSALLALNAALANGRATFPDGVIERHVDCRIYAAANTWGFGGTADYVGRGKIDAAFLSRFPAKFHWQYDNHVEQSVYGSQEFAEMVQRARSRAKSAGLKVLITPRDTQAGAALIAAGFSLQEAAEMTYLANLSPEQRTMVI